MAETPKHTPDMIIRGLPSINSETPEQIHAKHGDLSRIDKPEGRRRTLDIDSPSFEERRQAFLNEAADGSLVSFGGSDNWSRVRRTEEGVVLQPVGTLAEALTLGQEPKI